MSPPYKNPTCRGSYVLGSACGRCERCEDERASLAAQGIATPSAKERPKLSRPMEPSERYQTDPSFKHLVDMMEAMIQQADFSPSEMRIAAVLASIHFESRRLRRSVTTGDVRFGLYDGLNSLHEKMNDLVKADGL